MDAALQQCEVCRAFAKDPHVPIVGTSSTASVNEKLQLGRLFLGDKIALHAMATHPKYPPFGTGAFEKTLGGTKRLSQLTDCSFCSPGMHSDGVRGGAETWTLAESLNGASARDSQNKERAPARGPWPVGRRSVLAWGVSNGLVAVDRCSIAQALNEVQFCPNTHSSASGYSAYKMVFRSELADLLGWQGGDGDRLFAPEAATSGQFVQQWKLRMLAQAAALKGMANS